MCPSCARFGSFRSGYNVQQSVQQADFGHRRIIHRGSRSDFDLLRFAVRLFFRFSLARALLSNVHLHRFFLIFILFIFFVLLLE